MRIIFPASEHDSLLVAVRIAVFGKGAELRQLRPDANLQLRGRVATPRARRRELAALLSADSFLHDVTECLGIRAPSPGVVPGQPSFEIGPVFEKTETIDNTFHHLVKVGPWSSRRRVARSARSRSAPSDGREERAARAG